MRKLEIYQVAAKFVPQLLTQDQKDKYVFTMVGQLSQSQKNTAGNVERKSHVHIFLTSVVLCLMNCYLSKTNCESLVLYGSLKYLTENVRRERSKLWKTPPNFSSQLCASSLIATDSWFFGQSQHSCAPSAILFTWPGPNRHLLFLKLTLITEDWKH